MASDTAALSAGTLARAMRGATPQIEAPQSVSVFEQVLKAGEAICGHCPCPEPYPNYNSNSARTIIRTYNR